MAVFDSPYFDDHEQVAHCHDPASGLKAVIAIHSSVLGPALGGCRMWPYASQQEAVDDVLRLSRGMTFKAAVAGLDLGGGKSVIIGHAERDKSRALLLAMGRFVESLGGRYHVAEDVGMTVADMDVMGRATRFVHGSSEDTGNPAPVTAYGVFVGLRAAVRHRLGRDELKGLTVSVQGVGSVGAHLCSRLAKAGAKIVAADLNRAAAERMASELGARTVAPEAIHRVPADVFAPCALGGVLDDRTVEELAAPIVAGSANNQLREDRHGALLQDRGILYAPDYVINAGGLIDVARKGRDRDRESVFAATARIADTLTAIFRRSDAEGRPTNIIADRMARARLGRASAERAAA